LENLSHGVLIRDKVGNFSQFENKTLNKFGSRAVQRMYKKIHHERLSLAYGVHGSSRANKTILVRNLVSVVQTCPNVPRPCFLSNLHAEPLLTIIPKGSY